MELALTAEELTELRRRAPIGAPIAIDEATGRVSCESHPFSSRTAQRAHSFLLDFLHTMNEARAHRHPLYRSLLRRVARAERSSGKYGSHWRAYERSSYGGTIGKPYDLAHDDLYARMKAANAVAKRMLADVYPRPWPAEGDMIANLYNIARDDVAARRVSS